MALRDRLRRLEHKAEGPVVSIPQRGGTVKRFPERELAPAFTNALDRATGRSSPDDSEGAEHPLCTAARNYSYRSGLLMSQRLNGLQPPGVTGEPFEEGGVFSRT